MHYILVSKPPDWTSINALCKADSQVRAESQRYVIVSLSAVSRDPFGVTADKFTTGFSITANLCLPGRLRILCSTFHLGLERCHERAAHGLVLADPIQRRNAKLPLCRASVRVSAARSEETGHSIRVSLTRRMSVAYMELRFGSLRSHVPRNLSSLRQFAAACAYNAACRTMGFRFWTELPV